MLTFPILLLLIYLFLIVNNKVNSSSVLCSFFSVSLYKSVWKKVRIHRFLEYFCRSTLVISTYHIILISGNYSSVMSQVKGYFKVSSHLNSSSFLYVRGFGTGSSQNIVSYQFLFISVVSQVWYRVISKYHIFLVLFAFLFRVVWYNTISKIVISQIFSASPFWIVWQKVRA